MTDHEYLSTGCLHGEHAYCQGLTGQAGPKKPGRCKFCDAPCVCPCHQPQAPGAWLPRDIFAPVSEAEHAAVRRVQRALKLSLTGELDEPTKTALRGLQALFKRPVTGVLDRDTAALVERVAHTYPED